MPTIIEWKIEVSDNVKSIIKEFESIDSALFENKSFMQALWSDMFQKISISIKKRFEEGASSWRPLTQKYQKWKTTAVRNGKTVPVGSFGRRVCRLNELGRLTDTMFVSATERDKFANITEINNNPKFSYGSFRYAISGSKLPHAVYFDDKRPFFFLTQQESDDILDNMSSRFEDIFDDNFK